MRDAASTLQDIKFKSGNPDTPGCLKRISNLERDSH